MGSTSGFGAKGAQLFAKQGATVVCSDMRFDDGKGQNPINAIIAKGYPAYFYNCNVTEEASVEKLINFAWEKFGRLDVFWNCAEVEGSTRKSILNLSLLEFDTVFDVNFNGTRIVFVCRVIVFCPFLVINYTNPIGSLCTAPSLTARLLKWYKACIKSNGKTGYFI